MLMLLALTSFHGVTMLEGWQLAISQFARYVGDSGQLLVSFSAGLVLCWLLPICLYFGLTWLCSRLADSAAHSVEKMFAGFAFASIPLAFSYHIAHNLNHLLREGSDWPALFANPMGEGTLPLSMAEKHARYMNMAISEESLFTLQALLLIGGFYLAVQVLRHRGAQLFNLRPLQLAPMLVFAISVTGFNLWLLMQNMTMRM